MVTKLMHLLEKLTGALLGGVGMGALIGNVLVCLSMMLLGPAYILGIFPQ